MIKIIKLKNGIPCILILKTEYKDFKSFLQWKNKYWNVIR